jgi:F-type H+-transporting ATPase subunit delta
MQIPRVARRYAEALYKAVPPDPGLDSFLEDLRSVRASLAASRELRIFFSSPIIPLAKKREVVRQLFIERLHSYTFAVLEFLLTKRREQILASIIDAVFDEHRRTLGIATATVTTARPLGDGQPERIARTLEGIAHGPVEVAHEVHPELLGGIVVRLGDTVYDGSVAHHLARLRERFLS